MIDFKKINQQINKDNNQKISKKLIAKYSLINKWINKKGQKLKTIMENTSTKTTNEKHRQSIVCSFIGRLSQRILRGRGLMTSAKKKKKRKWERQTTKDKTLSPSRLAGREREDLGQRLHTRRWLLACRTSFFCIGNSAAIFGFWIHSRSYEHFFNDTTSKQKSMCKFYLTNWLFVDNENVTWEEWSCCRCCCFCRGSTFNWDINTNSHDRGILLPSKHENRCWNGSERLSSCCFRCCYGSSCYEQQISYRAAHRNKEGCNKSQPRQSVIVPLISG